MDRFGIFAKYWQPTAVKTRLARAIGARPASELYRVFVETLLLRCAAVADQRVLCYWPPQRREDFAAVVPAAWQLDPQVEGDLGQRMSHFFAASLKEGFARTVLIGSDSPTLPLDLLDRAFQLLRTHAVVLGPTVDGGYYLVGVAGDIPPIFHGVHWSTPEVWRQTVQRLRSAEIPFAELPQWYDVDQAADLRRLRAELVQLRRHSSAWSALLEAVEEVLSE